MRSKFTMIVATGNFSAHCRSNVLETFTQSRLKLMYIYKLTSRKKILSKKYTTNYNDKKRRRGLAYSNNLNNGHINIKETVKSFKNLSISISLLCPLDTSVDAYNIAVISNVNFFLTNAMLLLAYGISYFFFDRDVLLLLRRNFHASAVLLFNSFEMATRDECSPQRMAFHLEPLTRSSCTTLLDFLGIFKDKND